ncbi:hypothetical protein ACFE04_020602 [Oxalis oulophora]
MAHWVHRIKSSSSSSSSPDQTLGILAFETAKIMSNLIDLYGSVTDEGFSKLRNVSIKTVGVSYLVSRNEAEMLSLACAEKLEELQRVSRAIYFLGQKCCSGYEMTQFDDSGTMLQQFGTRSVERIVDKMEKLVIATMNLHSTIVSLRELEASERTLKKWDSKLKPNLIYFEEKIALSRKQVKHFRKNSLWTQTFDRTVSLMSLLVSIVYARISFLFRNPSKLDRMLATKFERHIFNSGPIPTTLMLHKYLKLKRIRFCSCGSLPEVAATPNFQFSKEFVKIGEKIQQVGPSTTVGEAGLMVRYANIIILAEKYLNEPTLVDDNARKELYGMLPQSLRSGLRVKLWRRKEKRLVDYTLARGWRDPLDDMMAWLAPMAHDTMKWVAERNLERQRLNFKQPKVMLLQTLYHADTAKTEAAIVEVLVGLSCIFRYENRRQIGDGTTPIRGCDSKQ